MIKIPTRQANQMKQSCESGYPYEVCGILVGQDNGSEAKSVQEIETLTNSARENKEKRFLIDPLDLGKLEMAADARGLKVLGIFHSHPDHPAEPSPTDLEFAWPYFSYIILSVEKGKCSVMRSFRLHNDRKQFFEEEIEVL